MDVFEARELEWYWQTIYKLVLANIGQASVAKLLGLVELCIEVCVLGSFGELSFDN